MTKMTFDSNTVTPAVWAGDFISREHMIPGGAQVDAAQWTADANGKKPIPSGTLIGRTFAERDAGDAFGKADAADDEVYLTAFDVTDAVALPDVELYRPGSVVKENFLPDWGAMSAALKAVVRAKYATQTGVA